MGIKKKKKEGREQKKDISWKIMRIGLHISVQYSGYFVMCSCKRSVNSCGNPPRKGIKKKKSILAQIRTTDLSAVSDDLTLVGPGSVTAMERRLYSMGGAGGSHPPIG